MDWSKLFGITDDEQQPEAPPTLDSVPLATGLKKEQAAGGIQEADTPDVMMHIAQKNGLAEQYKALAKDDADVKAARAEADEKAGNIGLIQGLSTMFAGAKKTDANVYNSLRKQANEGVKRAEGDRENRLKEFLTTDQLRASDEKRQREAADREELTSPSSKKSQLANQLGLSRALSLRNEAKQAGDLEGAAQFDALAKELQGGKYSAAQIGDLKLLDKADYKDVLKNKADMARAKMQEKGANERTQMQMGAEDRRLKSMRYYQEKDLRADIDKDPQMRQAVQMDQTLNDLTAMASDPNSVSDEALLMKWQKALDPNSVVRESEFARTQAGQGLLSQLEMAVNKASGEGRLTPELRQQIVQASAALKNAHGQYAKAKLDRVNHIIDQYGLDRDNVYGAYHEGLAQSANAAPAAGAAAPAAHGEIKRKTADGRTAIFDANKKFLRYED